MVRLPAAFFVVLVALFATASPPALASQRLSGTVKNFEDAPFNLIGCGGALVDTEVGNVDYYIKPNARYSNNGTKHIVALEVQFTLLNSFDEVLGHLVGVDDKGLGPGLNSEATWSWLNLYPTVRKIECAPYRARFSDATTWTNDFKVHARPADASAPPTNLEHPATCKVTLADKSRIDIPWDNPGCAAERKAFAAKAHPATCSVKLADGRTIDIPWNNPGCTDVRKTWASGKESAGTVTAPPAVASIDFTLPLVDGHPEMCVVRDGVNAPRYPQWTSDSCEEARVKWSLLPSYMREELWDSHDGAPENLDRGHPAHCTPWRDKTVHWLWSSGQCNDARLKWEALHPKT